MEIQHSRQHHSPQLRDKPQFHLCVSQSHPSPFAVEQAGWDRRSNQLAPPTILDQIPRGIPVGQNSLQRAASHDPECAAIERSACHRRRRRPFDRIEDSQRAQRYQLEFPPRFQHVSQRFFEPHPRSMRLLDGLDLRREGLS